MADIRIEPQQVEDVGRVAAYTSPLTTTDTYLVRNDGRVFLHFKKSGAGACTVTVQTPKTIHGLAVADRTASVAASGGETFVGPFPAEAYDDKDHDVRFTVSEITGLSVAALRV